MSLPSNRQLAVISACATCLAIAAAPSCGDDSDTNPTTSTSTTSGTGGGVGGDAGDGGTGTGGGVGGSVGGSGGAIGGAGGAVGGSGGVGGAVGGSGGVGGVGGSVGGAGGAGGAGGSNPVVADHLLISEVVVTPTEGEYIEIHNPTGNPIALADYYLTDGTNMAAARFYYNIVLSPQTGSDSGYQSDFHIRFPANATIAAGAYQVISVAGSTAYQTTYSAAPTYEISDDPSGTGGSGGTGGAGGAGGGGPDNIPDMLEAYSGSIGSNPGLTDGHEVVVLYRWDGTQDLVEDVDYVLWGDKSESVEKNGISIDSDFDSDSTTSAYLNDTIKANQAVCATASHTAGNSYSRIDDTEGTESGSGNGITGDDETSENLDVTFDECVVSPLAAATSCP